MRLIDADELMRRFMYKRAEYYHASYIVGEINTAPTIDAVPVVRCKDCKWHEQEQPGMVYCPATVCGWVEDDWFCKGGERKDDDRA